MLVNHSPARTIEAQCGSSGSPMFTGGGAQRCAPILGDRISHCCPPPLGPGDSPAPPSAQNPMQPLIDAIAGLINVISTLIASLGASNGVARGLPIERPQPVPAPGQEPAQAPDPVQALLEAAGVFMKSIGGPLAKLFGGSQVGMHPF